jgi:anti-sigma factor RsiW
VNGRPLPDDLLSAYLDGECTPGERSAVEARLAADPRWRAELEAVRGAREALRGLPVREPPAGFVESLLIGAAATGRAALASAPAFDEPVARRARHARRGAFAAASAAAAVVVAVVVATPEGGGGQEVSPRIVQLSQTHAATAGLGADPVSGLAPAAVPVELQP